MSTAERKQQNYSRHRKIGPKSVWLMGEATRMPVCNAAPQKDLETEAPVVSKGRSQGRGSKFLKRTVRLPGNHPQHLTARLGPILTPRVNGIFISEISNTCFPIMKSQGTTKTPVWHWTENRDSVEVCTPIMRPLSFLSAVAPRISLGAEFTLPKTGDHRIPELRN